MADDIKFRALPRSNESKKPQVEEPEESSSLERIPRFIVVAALAGALVAVVALLNTPTKPVKNRELSSAPQETSLVEDRVTRHLQEMANQREMATHNQELENERLTTPIENDPNQKLMDPPKDRILGLQLDQENSSEKVYADLNAQSQNQTELSPEDRINARLANNKWLKETERAEQKQFVANFIRAAAQNGYEITLNEQLVVVKVRRVPGAGKVSIDKILDQLSRRPSSP